MISVWEAISRELPRLFRSGRSLVIASCLVCAAQSFAQSGSKTTGPPNVSSAQQTNDRIAQLALAATVKQGEYLIGSGDLLAIEVFDVPELSREVRVDQSGYVGLP